MTMRALRASDEIAPVSERDPPADRPRFVVAVQDGLEDADARRLRDHDEVLKRMRARFGSKDRR